LDKEEQDTLNHIYSLLDDYQVDSLIEHRKFVNDKRYRMKNTIYTHYIFDIRTNPERRDELFIFLKEDWPIQFYNSGNPTVRVQVENEVVHKRQCRRLYDTLSKEGKVDFWDIVDAIDLFIFE